MAKPELIIDKTCEAAYLRVSKKKAELTKIMKNGLVVDYDGNGWLIGIEFLDLSVLTKMLNDSKVEEIEET